MNVFDFAENIGAGEASPVYLFCPSKGERARTATFEVDTEQAQMLALAQQLGSLSLALRGTTALEVVATRRIGPNELTAPAPAQSIVPPSPAVRVRRGTEAPAVRQVPR